MAQQLLTEDETRLENTPASKRNGKAGSRKEKPVASNSFRLGYLIHDVSRMRRTLVDQHMRPEGVTRSQWWVLANLSRHGNDGIKSTELAKLLDVGKVTLGGLIDRLEIAGYVYRRASKEDRRAKHIFISEAGYSLIGRMRVIVEELNLMMCKGLSTEEVSAMEHGLLQIKHNIREVLNDSTLPSDDMD